MSDDSASSLGKKILGLFVETDPPSDGTAPPPRPQVKAVPVGIANIHAGSVDPEMLATLQKKINARSSPYVTLIEASQRLANVIPDETTRLKAAFAMVSGDGNRSVTSITQAIDVHIADLEGERIRFKNASDEQTRSKSAALRSQAESLSAQNTESTRQIERLQAEITKLQDTIVKNTALCRDLNLQADSADAEIKAVSAAFDRTVDYLKNDLSTKKISLTSLLS